VNFEFATASEIVFGWGRAAELGKRARRFGRRALLITGAHRERIQPVRELIEAAGVACHGMSVVGEPTVDDATRGANQAREVDAELVIAIGGGSVLDAGKAIAALIANPGPVTDYLEVVGLGRPLALASLPLLAVPTTAGTGSEVTRNAVLKVVEKRLKVSLRGLSMLPRLALVDPELTVTLPANVTAATGLDALTQVIEPYISKARGPLTDALCLEGIRRAARSLRVVFTDGANREGREDLALTSLFGGLALANAKLGAVHGFAAPLGGYTDAAHGALCARLLPEVMLANLEAARAERNSDVLDRLTTVATLLTSDNSAPPEAGIEWLAQLVEDLRVPRLAALGVRGEDVPALVDQARNASSMKGNPFELSLERLTQIVERAM